MFVGLLMVLNFYNLIQDRQLDIHQAAQWWVLQQGVQEYSPNHYQRAPSFHFSAHRKCTAHLDCQKAERDAAQFHKDGKTEVRDDFV